MMENDADFVDLDQIVNEFCPPIENVDREQIQQMATHPIQPSPVAFDMKLSDKQLLELFLKSHEIETLQSDAGLAYYLTIDLMEAYMTMKHRFRLYHNINLS